MNLSAPFIYEFFKGALDNVLPQGSFSVKFKERKFYILILIMFILGFKYMDYVFGNETEVRTFSKAQGWEVIIN